MQEEGCVIPHTTANEELVLSLLDRFIDVTNISFGALADKFYQHVPDELGDLRYHGRQVSFYMKRERPISPNHWNGVAEFVYSNEFIETLPEARVIIRQQESVIEAGVYFSKLNGLIDKSHSGDSFPKKYSGFWDGLSGFQVYIQKIDGYSFAIAHWKSWQAPTIFSGFVFPTQKNSEELKEATPNMNRCDGLDIYDIYLWDRLSRSKVLSEIYPLYVNGDQSLLLTSLTLHPDDLEKKLDEVLELPIHDRDGKGEFVVTETIINTVGNNRRSGQNMFEFAGHDKKQLTEFVENKAKESSEVESTLTAMASFISFIEKNLGGVLGDGPDC